MGVAFAVSGSAAPTDLMPLIPIKLRPGIDSVRTPTLNEGGWSVASNIRFFDGLPQKDGGFVIFTNASVGIPKALKAWTALSGISHLAIGGSQRLNVFKAGAVFDITPLTISSSVPISLSTTIGSATVTITDSVNTPAANKWLQIRDPVSGGGIVLYGSYMITGTGSGNYTITAPVAATSAVTNGGSCRTFTSNGGSAVVTVGLPNHGLFNGQIVPVQDAVSVGGLTLQGNYLATVIDANTYTITAQGTTVANGHFTVTENGGSIEITFFNPASGGSQQNIDANTYSLDNWGEFLLACPERGPIFAWMPAGGTSVPAADVTTAPQSNGFIFVASQVQQVVACGSVNPVTGLFDPMLVRWSDTGDYTSWIPSVSNQAGSFRLTAGSELRAGLALPGQNYLWTDLALYSMQYIQPPLVWGFQPLGINCGAAGPHAIGVPLEQVVWESQNQFMRLGAGGPEFILCPVWDQVFPNADRANLKNVVCETNSWFGEVGWSVPQNDGTVVFVRLQMGTGAWTSSAYHHHTAWIDQNAFGAPIGGHENGFIDQHEVGVDANGVAASASLTTGMIMIAEGEGVTFVREVIPDIKFLAPGTVQMTALFYDYPNKLPRVKGPVLLTSATQTAPGIRGRGRQIQFTFSSNDLGSMWRLGNVRYRGQPDGRR